MNKTIRKHYLQLTDDNKALYEETEVVKKEISQFYEQVKAFMTKMENRYDAYKQINTASETIPVALSEMENNLLHTVTDYKTFINGLVGFLEQGVALNNKIAGYINIIKEGGEKMVNNNLTNKHCEKILHQLEEGMQSLKNQFEQFKSAFAEKKLLLHQLSLLSDKLVN
ncbi:MAG: hypothetical protein HY841_01160 [Bacteroidetes bacterium]|nr:hypothetical protein [Bacteroidota bacterium]